MLTIIVLTPLEHRELIDVVTCPTHPQSFRAGERADGRPELDRPDRCTVLVVTQRLNVVDERHPSGIHAEVADMTEQCIRRDRRDQFSDDLHGGGPSAGPVRAPEGPGQQWTPRRQQPAQVVGVVEVRRPSIVRVEPGCAGRSGRGVRLRGAGRPPAHSTWRPQPRLLAGAAQRRDGRPRARRVRVARSRRSPDATPPDGGRRVTWSERDGGRNRCSSGSRRSSSVHPSGTTIESP